MMNFNPKIFKAYDIRGIYGQDFDEDFAFRLGMALVQFSGRGNFLLARDERQFSRDLSGVLAKGMAAAGADVIDLGVSTTPFFNFVFKRLGFNGGVVVTASHLGPEYGGFKIFGKNGEIIGLDLGLAHIKEILERGNAEQVKYAGIISGCDREKLMIKYVDFILKQSKVAVSQIKNIKIKIDAPHLADEEIALFLGKIGLTNHESGYDVMFQLDYDADRLNTFDGTGQHIHSDLIAGLLVKNMIGFWSKPKLVYDLRFSLGVLEKLDELKIKRFRSRVGRAFLNQNARKQRADIGGELSGHIIFKTANYQELPLLALLRILGIIGQDGKNINELVSEFKTWENSGEINTPINDWPAIAAKLKSKYQDGKINEIDGVTVEYLDSPSTSSGQPIGWWFNVRPSNTEPIVRLVVEAKTKNLLDEKVAEIKNLIEATSW